MILIPLLDKVTLGWSKQEDDFFMAAIKPICFNLTCHTADTRLDCLVGIDHTETKRGLSTTNYLSGPCTQGLNLVICNYGKQRLCDLPWLLPHQINDSGFFFQIVDFHSTGLCCEIFLFKNIYFSLSVKYQLKNYSAHVVCCTIF